MGLLKEKLGNDSNKNGTEMIQRFANQRMGKNLLQFVSTKIMIINTRLTGKIQNREKSIKTIFLQFRSGYLFVNGTYCQSGSACIQVYHVQFIKITAFV